MNAAPETRSSRDAVPLADTVRAGDYDRYLTTLFAPPEARPALIALIALNLELARVRDLIVEPMIGHIRLQWWRDAIAEALAGTPRNQEVLAALAQARERIPQPQLDEMVDAREIEMAAEPPPTVAAFEGYASGTSGALAEAMAAVLSAGKQIPSGAEEAARHAGRENDLARAAREVGTAFGMIGVLRATRYQAQRGRVLLPADVLAETKVSVDSIKRLRAEPGLADAARRIVDRARVRLAEARAMRAEIAKADRAPLLLAPLADVYARRLSAVGFDVFADLSVTPLRKQLAVGWSALTGRY